MRVIQTWRDPYGEGFSTCRPKKIEIAEGLTVLVGCNGAGKTTLLNNIKDELKKNNVPVIMFDNLRDGGSSGLGSAAFNEDWSLMAGMMSSSEGETIGLNIGIWAKGISNFIFTGKYKSGRKEDKLSEIFMSTDEDFRKEMKSRNKALQDHKERWILIDAADSGYSIDNVIELKDLFQLMFDDAKSVGKELYIIISANQYELARNEQCFDVNTGKYLTFKDYEDYRKFIIKSREKKDRRYEKLYETSS